MAEILTLAGYLTLGVAIGWAINAWRYRRRYSRAVVCDLAAEWNRHVEAHAKAQEGSVALTAPPAAYIPLPDGQRLPLVRKDELDPQSVGRALDRYQRRFGA